MDRKRQTPNVENKYRSKPTACEKPDTLKTRKNERLRLTSISSMSSVPLPWLCSAIHTEANRQPAKKPTHKCVRMKDYASIHVLKFCVTSLVMFSDKYRNKPTACKKNDWQRKTRNTDNTQERKITPHFTFIHEFCVTSSAMLQLFVLTVSSY